MENETKDEIEQGNSSSEELEPEENTSEKAVDNLMNWFKEPLKIEKKGAEPEGGCSPHDMLKLAEENWGMRFSDTFFQNSTFILNQSEKVKKTSNQPGENLLIRAEDSEVLAWCSKHFTDFYFSFFLSMCILDRQPYGEIFNMAQELKKEISDVIRNEEKEEGIFYKSQLIKVLGIVEYPDMTMVRGQKLEVDFLRLPSHEQAFHFICLLIKEFPQMSFILSQYLVGKIITVYKERKNYTIISNCSEALANIGVADIAFFNTYTIRRFLDERSAGMDSCLAVLLKHLYQREESRDFVNSCVQQWGELRNNPHYALIVLNVCEMIGGQENRVCSVWTVILEELLKEYAEETKPVCWQYADVLQDLFACGNRSINYYKGVIHAFYNCLQKLRERHKRFEAGFVESVFLMFIIYDYSRCNIVDSKRKRLDMIWVGIFSRIDEKTGKELSFLWASVLKNRHYLGEGWKVLKLYLLEYKKYDKADTARLAFFFYWVDRELLNDRVERFLMECKGEDICQLPIAKSIYKSIKKEKTHGGINC